MEHHGVNLLRQTLCPLAFYATDAHCRVATSSPPFINFAVPVHFTRASNYPFTSALSAPITPTFFWM